MDTHLAVKVDPENAIKIISGRLATNNFCHVRGPELLKHIEVSHRQVDHIISFWPNLVLDHYMADGGIYRYRRYGQFELSARCERLNLMPHEAYKQSSEINKLNGDVQRYFEPLETEFSNALLLEKLLKFMAKIYNDRLGQNITWNIKLHPYRIIANTGSTGKPTPEGLHRDGVTFVASLLLQRSNIVGGITTITNNDGELIEQIEMTEPFEIIMADDANSMHEVSPIRAISDKDNFRDVLVIAFTKQL